MLDFSIGFEPYGQDSSQTPSQPSQEAAGEANAHPLAGEQARRFVLAGKAIFTLQGKESRFTYRVSLKQAQPGDRFGDTYFVGVLSGPDNTSDYRYLGILDPSTGYVRLTRNSKFTLNAPSVKALHWVLPKLWKLQPIVPAQLLHAGYCGRCGRLLTTPDSIRAGFGPECLGKL